MFFTVHGITKEFLSAINAPPINVAMTNFVHFLNDTCQSQQICAKNVLAAHNGKFDFKMIEQSLQHCDSSVQSEYHSLFEIQQTNRIEKLCTMKHYRNILKNIDKHHSGIEHKLSAGASLSSMLSDLKIDVRPILREYQAILPLLQNDITETIGNHNITKFQHSALLDARMLVECMKALWRLEARNNDCQRIDDVSVHVMQLTDDVKIRCKIAHYFNQTSDSMILAPFLYAMNHYHQDLNKFHISVLSFLNEKGFLSDKQKVVAINSLPLKYKKIGYGLRNTIKSKQILQFLTKYELYTGEIIQTLDELRCRFLRNQSLTTEEYDNISKYMPLSYVVC